MKFRITLKDPDGVYDSIENTRKPCESCGHCSDRDGFHETIHDDATFRKFVECAEYVTIELDTDAGTARVVPVGE